MNGLLGFNPDQATPRWRERRAIVGLGLSVSVKRAGVEKWLRGERRDAGCESPVKPNGAPRITYTLLPACELVLRAVDAETGRGLPGAEFYTENAVGEEWAHPVYGENLGSKFVSGSRQAGAETYLTDNDGNFRRLVSANAGFKYGVWKAPAGYEHVEPGREVEIDIPCGRPRAEHVFKFRRTRKPAPSAGKGRDACIRTQHGYDGPVAGPMRGNAPSAPTIGPVRGA
jgi:hypothetical protein